MGEQVVNYLNPFNFLSKNKSSSCYTNYSRVGVKHVAEHETLCSNGRLRLIERRDLCRHLQIKCILSSRWQVETSSFS